MKTFLSVIVLLLCLGLAGNGFAGNPEEIVFTGLPILKISEGGISRIPETLTKEKKVKLLVRKLSLLVLTWVVVGILISIIF